jgi:hypothetical protein
VMTEELSGVVCIGRQTVFLVGGEALSSTQRLRGCDCTVARGLGGRKRGDGRVVRE